MLQQASYLSPESLVALVSVLVTGLISFTSVFVPVWTDSQKAKREEVRALQEKKAAKLAKIDNATLELLGLISVFRFEESRDVDRALTRDPRANNIHQAASALQGAYYSWESAIWELLGQDDRDRAKELRNMFERSLPAPDEMNDLVWQVSKLSDEILSISRSATNRS